MHRRLPLTLALTSLAALSLAGPASAQQVASCNGAYSITAQSWAVPGARVAVIIRHNDDSSVAQSDDSVAPYLLVSDGATGEELARVNVDVEGLDLYTYPERTSMQVAMPDVAENESVRITMVWAEWTIYPSASPGTAVNYQAASNTCQSVAVVAARAGAAPRFRISGDSLVVVGTCAQTRAMDAVVTFKRGPRTRRLNLPDLCRGWNSAALTLAGIAVNATDADPDTGERASLKFRSTGNRRYTMEVRSEGKLVMKRTVASHRKSHPDVRVYRGTDAFWNYCINTNRDIYSSHGRLYCVSPGYTKRRIDIS